MSFLAPLYLLGLAAVALPLVFHLIRRTPRGRFAFSSLMFLEPSPPRLTRRSRLDNILLLLLRAAALMLLAAAFARPFLRSLASTAAWDQEQRKIAIVVDTSASLQRGDLWSQASRLVDQVLDDLDPGDDAALVRFADDHETLVGFEDAPPADPANKIARIRNAIDGLRPGWGGSNLGEALVAVADDLDRERASGDRDVQSSRQIVLVTDLQEGCRIDALRSYSWPEDVRLVVQQVRADGATNAGVHPAPAVPDAAGEDIRVRVSNSRDSSGEQFQLAWEAEAGGPRAEPIRVYVPAGESRVVRVPRPAAAAGARRLVLSGDDHAFDNTLHRVELAREEVRVVYLGGDSAEDPQGLRYYLERAYPETPRRTVLVESPAVDAPLSVQALAGARLVVVRDGADEGQVAPLQAYVRQGGTLLVVLTDAAAAAAMEPWLGDAAAEVLEAELDDFALLGQIDFRDPLFAPLADPRFNDFTTIHFWKHRAVRIPDEETAHVLARFDDGDPALFELPEGDGRVLVLTAGWNPGDSQLARSTKFVPLMHGLLERRGGSGAVSAEYEVGQPVELPPVSAADAERFVRTPEGARLQLDPDQRVFDQTGMPGVYVLAAGGREQAFAVNVPGRESATPAMSPDELQEQGIRLGTATTRGERVERQRQMRDVELEGRQKLWRWLIAAALGLLLVETWLAGHLARQSVQPVGTA